MIRYFIETSSIIHYLRGDEEAIQAIDNLQGDLTSSTLCLAELYEGIARVKDAQQAEKDILRFFAGLSEVFGIDQDIAKQFGTLRAELKQKGKIIEDIDLFIAATCTANNLTLVTHNRAHFMRIKNLQIFLWPS